MLKKQEPYNWDKPLEDPRLGHEFTMPVFIFCVWACCNFLTLFLCILIRHVIPFTFLPQDFGLLYLSYCQGE